MFACDRLPRCGPGPDWVFWVRIVVNELAEVCEQVELQERLRWRSGYNFSILAVGRRRRVSPKDKCVFILLSQALWIDVVVPHQSRGNERVRHSAASKDKTREAVISAICLADVDRVAVFFEWSAATGRVTGCVVAKRYAS